MAASDKALDLARQVNVPEIIREIHFNRASFEVTQGRFKVALEKINEAIRIAEEQRLLIGPMNLRTAFSVAKPSQYYSLKTEILMQLHKSQPGMNYDQEAFHTQEQARARTLLETLSEGKADIRSGVSPGLLVREREARKNLIAKSQGLTRLLSGKYSEKEKNDLEQELRSATQVVEEIEMEVRQTSPHYAAMTRPQPLRLMEVQSKVVDSNTVLLEYALGEERSYLWVVTSERLMSYELPKREIIESAAIRFYHALSSNNSGAEHLTAGTQLCQLILAPALEELGTRRLFIVADGILQYIPFAAIPVSKGKEQLRFLVEDHEILYLPSASTLGVARNELSGRKSAPKAFAVLADPVFSSSDKRVSKIPTAKLPLPEGQSHELSAARSPLERAIEATGGMDAGSSLQRLSLTRRTMEQILLSIPANQQMRAFDFDANYDLATSSELGQYRVIHFATHGFLNPVNPELSGIVLSLVTKDGTSQPNGYLKALDVFNLILPAELVVLHACKTGLGVDPASDETDRQRQERLKKIRSEGVVGLTQGFIYAGTRRVMVSLWDIGEQSSSTLMKRFYKYHFGPRKLGPAAALRAAQLEMLKEKQWVAPSSWSSFVIFGDW